MYLLSKKLPVMVCVVFMISFTFLALNLAPQAIAQEKETFQSQLDKTLSYYWEGEFEKATELAKSLFKVSRTREDSIGIYEALSVVTYAKGKKYLKQAMEYLKKIVELDPKSCRLPEEFWPDELKHNWYYCQDSVGVLSEPCVESPGIQTIAVVNFDNTSIEDHEKLEPLEKGLAAFFVTDLKKITKLRIVEREKINYVIEELRKGGTIYFDKKTVAKIGNLLGAHTMVFGSFMKLDKKHMRVDARVVKTETGELLVAESQEGNPKDIFKLEKNLVLKIAEALKIALNKEEKEEIQLGGTQSEDAANLYAQGLEYQDKFEYKKAYESYKEALEKDPNYTEAKEKMEILKPLI
jgi:TolB-like protein